jgi:hypothetical protein
VLPLARVEDAWARQRAMKARFLGVEAVVPAGHLPRGGRPPSARELRRTIGTDEHQAIAAEMARFL